MLSLLLGCARGLVVPGFEVHVDVDEGPCEERSNVAPTAESDPQPIANRSDQDRLVAIDRLIANVVEADALDGVVPTVHLPDGGDAFAVPAESEVQVVAEVDVFCLHGESPPVGRYEREVPMTSTTLAGGDAHEQPIEVVVVLE